MKRLFALVCAVLLCACLFPAEAFAADDVINVYNWGQYIADGSDGSIDVNAAFTEATGIRVNYMTFDSNETMYTKLKTGGSTYDVIIPSDYMVAKLIEEDMLLPLDFDNIPNYQYIDEAYRSTSYDPENRYSVPYTWGTVGIIYNSRYVDEADIGSWDLLWNEKYAGKILMFDNPRDAFAVTESYLGYSLNTETPAELNACADLLIAQKYLVQSYVMDQIYDKMVRGEALVAPYYAGDYLMMADENEDLKFYFPSEGFNLFIDAMCIPKSCSNKAGAEAYINFLCSPEICGQNLDYLGYSVPESAAKEYLDPDTAASDIAYPDADTLSRGEAFVNLSQETSQLMDSLWLSVKTAGGVGTGPIVCMCVFVVAIAAWLIVRRITTTRRRARRCAKWKTS